MPNLYGVANAPGYPQTVNTIGVVAVVCTHDVYTAVFTSPPLIAPSAGYFYAMAWCNMNFSIGATPPSGLNIGIAIGAGSYANQYGYGTVGMAANAYLYMPFTIWSTASQTAWQGAGSTITIGFNPATNNATAQQYSTAIVCLFRAPDQ